MYASKEIYYKTPVLLSPLILFLKILLNIYSPRNFFLISTIFRFIRQKSVQRRKLSCRLSSICQDVNPLWPGIDSCGGPVAVCVTLFRAVTEVTWRWRLLPTEIPITIPPLPSAYAAENESAISHGTSGPLRRFPGPLFLLNISTVGATGLRETVKSTRC